MMLVLKLGSRDTAMVAMAACLLKVVQRTCKAKHIRDPIKEPGLQNAMTSSEERTSAEAEAEGYRIERSLTDCVAPPSRGGDAIRQCPRADSWLLRRIV